MNYFLKLTNLIINFKANNILTNLTPNEHSTSIDIIEKAILATDISIHVKYLLNHSFLFVIDVLILLLNE